MKIKIIRAILLILIIINCIIIFMFSNQDANESGKTSQGVIKYIYEHVPILKNIPEDTFSFIVRKTAHFSIYMLLGILSVSFALTYKGTKYQKGLASLCFGILYACSDEFHQLFIEGRSGEIRDVLIDSLGCLLGIFIVIFIVKIIQKMRKEQRYETLNKNTKIMFISSTGGHYTELMQLKKVIEECNYHIVTEKIPTNANLKEKYLNKIDYLMYGTKKTPIKYIFILMLNCVKSLFIYLKVRPQIIITTGTHTAGPMCCIGKILGSKIVYIETYANRNTKTATGRLLYFIADTFVVQWEEMLKLYPKAKYWGGIF